MKHSVRRIVLNNIFKRVNSVVKPKTNHGTRIWRQFIHESEYSKSDSFGDFADIRTEHFMLSSIQVKSQFSRSLTLTCYSSFVQFNQFYYHIQLTEVMLVPPELSQFERFRNFFGKKRRLFQFQLKPYN